MLAGIPLSAGDAAGAIAQLDLQKRVPVAISPQLLVADEENFLQSVSVVKFLHKTPSHIAYFAQFTKSKLRLTIIIREKKQRENRPSAAYGIATWNCSIMPINLDNALILTGPTASG